MSKAKILNIVILRFVGNDANCVTFQINALIDKKKFKYHKQRKIKIE